MIVFNTLLLLQNRVGFHVSNVPKVKYTFTPERFGSIDLQINQFIIGNQLNALLNSHLKITDYSETVKTIFVIFQCFAPDNQYIKTKEYLKYRRKTNVIELYLQMDYNLVKTASESEMKNRLVDLYAAAVARYLKRKDFDGEKFLIDFNKVAAIYSEG